MEDFLSVLESCLKGNMSRAEVRSNMDYYRDYFRTEQAKGRSYEEICAELGDPRMIARNIIDNSSSANAGGNGSGKGYFAQDGDYYVDSDNHAEEAGDFMYESAKKVMKKGVKIMTFITIAILALGFLAVFGACYIVFALLKMLFGLFF